MDEFKKIVDQSLIKEYNVYMTLNEKGKMLKNKLLKAGQEEIMKSSFNAVGVASISKAADLPKGSFFYYFPTKEQFAIELFEEYMENYSQEVKLFLSSQNHSTVNNQSGFERLYALYQNYYKKHKKNQWKTPCLFMKVYPEIAGMCKDIQLTIKKGVDKTIKLHLEVINRGVNDGSIALKEYTANELANIIFNYWKGAALISSVYLDDKPLKNFFQHLKTLCHHNTNRDTKK